MSCWWTETTGSRRDGSCIGLQAANDAEVLSGVTAGDRVVVSDRSSLKPGIEVQPQPVQGLEYQAGKEQQ